MWGGTVRGQSRPSSAGRAGQRPGLALSSSRAPVAAVPPSLSLCRVLGRGCCPGHPGRWRRTGWARHAAGRVGQALGQDSPARLVSVLPSGLQKRGCSGPFWQGFCWFLDLGGTGSLRSFAGLMHRTLMAGSCCVLWASLVAQQEESSVDAETRFSPWVGEDP